ncbi:MAG TPA: hypothetical protein VGS19_12440 [Streptosporangiaceae bacterium]|nr:hypothetical protein [Streptosporangiaceae bacterium]
MNRLEDRLQRDLRAQAEDIIPADVPQLRLPERPSRPVRWLWHRGTQRPSSWLTPLAAAVAVAAVITGTFAAVKAIHPAGQTQVKANTAGLPPYYVYLPTGWRSTAVVARTATGSVVKTLHAPRPFLFEDASGGQCSQSLSAAGDGEFMLMAVGPAPSTSSGPGPAVRFYLLRVSPSGATRMTAIHLPEPIGDGQNVCYGLSPDSQRLAVAYTPGSKSWGRTVIEVITLATGRAHRWSYTTTLCCSSIENLAWVTPRTLAFSVPFNAPSGPTASAPPAQDAAGTYLLDTAARGSRLLADSRRLTGASFQIQAATPDGTGLIVDHYQEHGGLPTLDEVSVRTGRVVRTYGQVSGDVLAAVLWSDPSGDRLVVAEVVDPMASRPPGPQFDSIGFLKPGGRKPGGTFTRLHPLPRIEGGIPGLAW